ncbi:unnamed protein product [Blepharisma stoltei]|uniref:Protein kinase domain-containing protein n=1 Tax=Blepharisma stoltei TaxID=1481888 RepID=A0AAU9JTX9_9CILI|nr:unnamed protein product [Blepharisma stoltei]
MSNIDQSVEFQTEPFSSMDEKLSQTCIINFEESIEYSPKNINKTKGSIRNYLLELRNESIKFKEMLIIKPENIEICSIEEFSVKGDSLYFPMKIIKFSGEFYFLKPIRSEKKIYGVHLEVYYRSRLRYSSIAKCIGYVKWEKSKFIIIQYFSKTLDQFLSENLSICDKITLIISLTKGLLFLHMKNCVNMNITPWSIFVDEDRNAYFFDLECVMNLNMEPQSSLVYKEPEFSAPEALDGKRSFACDIYSLGLLFYYILTGGPYSEYIGMENLPNGFEDLIKIMINSNPNKRPDAYYIIEELDRILIDIKSSS